MANIKYLIIESKEDIKIDFLALENEMSKILLSPPAFPDNSHLSLSPA